MKAAVQEPTTVRRMRLAPCRTYREGRDMDARNFTYRGSPARIVFGAGSLDRVAEIIESLGCARALVLSTPQQAEDAERLAQTLGALAVRVFARAAMHTPVEITNEAVAAMRAAGADCTVAFGGGSTTLRSATEPGSARAGIGIDRPVLQAIHQSIGEWAQQRLQVIRILDQPSLGGQRAGQGAAAVVRCGRVAITHDQQGVHRSGCRPPPLGLGQGE